MAQCEQESVRGAQTPKGLPHQRRVRILRRARRWIELDRHRLLSSISPNAISAAAQQDAIAEGCEPRRVTQSPETLGNTQPRILHHIVGSRTADVPAGDSDQSRVPAFDQETPRVLVARLGLKHQPVVDDRVKGTCHCTPSVGSRPCRFKIRREHFDVPSPNPSCPHRQTPLWAAFDMLAQYKEGSDGTLGDVGRRGDRDDPPAGR